MTAAPALRTRARDRRLWPSAGSRTAKRIATPARRAPALAAAIETMMRGATFLHGRAATLEQGGVSSAAHRATVLANSLRELDRFFIILLDELAAASGMSGQTLRTFRRRRSATAKLSAYPALFGHRIDDRTRLLTLAAQQSALLCRSLKSGSQRDAKLIIGAPAGTGLPTVNLQDVTAYYGRLTARIIRHVERAPTARPSGRRRPIAEPGTLPEGL